MQHLVQGGGIIIHSSAFRVSADIYPIETMQSETRGNRTLGRSKTMPYTTPFGGLPQLNLYLCTSGTLYTCPPEILRLTVTFSPRAPQIAKKHSGSVSAASSTVRYMLRAFGVELTITDQSMIGSAILYAATRTYR